MRAAGAIGIAVALGASPAIADDTATKPRPASYRTRLLAGDLLGGAAILLGFTVLTRFPSDGFTPTDLIVKPLPMVAGSILYLANGPVVHNRAGESGRAWGSFALRFFGPALVVLGGRQIYRENANNGTDELLWLSVGLVATSAIDFWLIARR